MRIDNGPGAWISSRPVDVQRRQREERDFGPGQFVSFTRYGVAPLSPEEWELQRELTVQLRDLGLADHVDSLPEIAQALGWDASRPPEGEQAEQLLPSPVVRGLLTGLDDRSVQVLAWWPEGQDAAKLELLRRAAEETGDWEVGGPLEFSGALDRLVFRDLLRVSVLLAAGLVLGGLWVLRSRRATFAMVVGGAAPCAMWLGGCGWFGFTLNGAQLGVIPFLAVMGAENAVHLVVENRRIGNGLRAARDLHGKLMLTSITTAASLAAFAIASVPFLRLVGFTTPPAALFSWAVTRFMIPGLLAGDGVGSGLGVHMRLPRPSAITAAVIVAFVLLAGGVSLRGIRTESNVALQLPPESKPASMLSRADETFGASMAFRVLATPVIPWMGPLTAMDAERDLAARASKALGSESVRVVGPQDMIDLARSADALDPPDEEFLAEARRIDGVLRDFRPSDITSRKQWDAWSGTFDRLKALQQSAPDIPMIHERTAAFLVLTPQLPGDDVAKLLDALEAPGGTGPERTNRVLSGLLPEAMRVQSTVLAEAGKSFALSLLLVSGCVALLLGSARAALVGLAINLAPFGVTLLLFRATGWALDMTSAQLFSMLLGFVVNSTIYMMASIRSGQDAATASESVVAAGVLSALVFSVPAFASLPSLQHFGVLAGVTVLAACAADVVLLPALVRRGTESHSSSGNSGGMACAGRASVISGGSMAARGSSSPGR